MIGRRNGNPRMSNPKTIGNNATAAVANGTVGTSNNFGDGNLSGNDDDNDLMVVFVAMEHESMIWNHDCASETMAPISVRYGPERHNLSLKVGTFVSCPLVADDDGDDDD